MQEGEGKWVTVTPPWLPSNQAVQVLDRISGLGKEGSIKKIFGEMLSRPKNEVDTLAKDILAMDHLIEKMGAEAYFSILACAYCVHTFLAEEKENWDLAWTSAMDASFWSGAAVGTNVLGETATDFIKNMKTDQARRAASFRHAENRELKADALKWYQLNKGNYSSKDAAAEDIAGKVVPVKFRTARDWLSKI